MVRHNLLNCANLSFNFGPPSMGYVPPNRQALWSGIIDLKEFIEIDKPIDGYP